MKFVVAARCYWPADLRSLVDFAHTKDIKDVYVIGMAPPLEDIIAYDATSTEPFALREDPAIKIRESWQTCLTLPYSKLDFVRPVTDEDVADARKPALNPHDQQEKALILARHNFKEGRDAVELRLEKHYERLRAVNTGDVTVYHVGGPLDIPSLFPKPPVEIREDCRTDLMLVWPVIPADLPPVTQDVYLTSSPFDGACNEALNGGRYPTGDSKLRADVQLKRRFNFDNALIDQFTDTYGLVVGTPIFHCSSFSEHPYAEHGIVWTVEDDTLAVYQCQDATFHRQRSFVLDTHGAIDEQIVSPTYQGPRPEQQTGYRVRFGEMHDAAIRGDWNEARKKLDALVRAYPTPCTTTSIWEGVVRKQLGEVGESIPFFEQAIKQSDDLRDIERRARVRQAAHTNLAGCYLQLGNEDSARQHYQRALEAHFERGPALNELAKQLLP